MREEYGDIVLTGVTIIGGDTAEPVDVSIKDGVIVEIGAGLDPEEGVVIDGRGKYVSPGWMDMHVHLREPGFEYKETIRSGCEAAASGGFTAVACMPNTNPPIHTRDVVEFVVDRARDLPVDVFPIATVSKEREGRELAEMADLKAGGAVAFSDDGSPVQNAGLMRRALEYASMLGCPIINHMEDLDLNPDGHMHEGSVSTRLGLPGIPALSEDVMIARDLLITAATRGRLHVAHVSTAGGVELVRRAKADGVTVTAEACPHHFTLTDEAVESTDFSTNTKMHPPLRSRKDVEAVRAGLADGTIDAVCTDHAPHASFEKEVEFIAAPNGIIGLETAWGLIGRELIGPGHLTLEEAVEKITVAPRRILDLPVPKIAVGERANLTLFDASTEWIFEEGDIHSLSKNTPFIGERMVGRAWGIYNKGRWIPSHSLSQSPAQP